MYDPKNSSLKKWELSPFLFYFNYPNFWFFFVSCFNSFDFTTVLLKSLDLLLPCSMCLKIKYSSSAGKESTCNVGDLGSIPGLRRSPGEVKGYPLQYSCLENSMDYIVHGVAKSQTRLSDFHFTNRKWEERRVI